MPVTIPPADPSLKQDERATDRYYQKHCPSGLVSFTGKFHCAYWGRTCGNQREFHCRDGGISNAAGTWNQLRPWGM